jgi:nucleoside-diphosphate-sugar epimerase
MESPEAENNDFNISTPVATTVLELAEKIWSILKPEEEFQYVCETGFEYDVQMRVPNVTKAKELLGFEAMISLEDSVNEVINYMKKK